MSSEMTRRKPILCVDFDGVIHSYESGWKGADVIPDPPVPGAVKWLDEATKHWDVQIYSSRSKEPAGIDAMVEFIDMCAASELGSIEKGQQLVNKLTFPTQKPAAFLTIDDRAVCFNGDFDAINPEKLLEFEPWYKR